MRSKLVLNFTVKCNRTLHYSKYQHLPSKLPVPVAAPSKTWVCGRSPAEIVDSNPTVGMDVRLLCRVLSGRGLCDELITLPEESY